MHKVMQDIKQMMQQKQISIQDIADQCGKDRVTVFRQLDPESNPTIATLEDYEKLLGGELRFIEEDTDVELLKQTNDQWMHRVQQLEAEIQFKNQRIEQQEVLLARRLEQCERIGEIMIQERERCYELGTKLLKLMEEKE